MSFNNYFKGVAQKSGAAFLLFAVIASPFAALVPEAQAAVVFTNSFEAGATGNASLVASNEWTQADNDWTITNGSGHLSSRKAQVSDQGDSADILRKAISTVGQNNIVLSYYYRTGQPLESNDHVYVEWTNNGSTWTQLVDHTNLDNGGWTQASFNLPSGANNAANFAFRFRATGLEASTGQGDKDEFQLDAVSYSTDTVPTTATLTLLKSVTNNNGGTATDGQFTLVASGPTNTSGVEGSAAVNDKAVNPGAYTLSETGGPSGYTASLYLCVKNNTAPVVSNSITLAAGDVATCTITNDDKPAALVVNKVVVGGTATSSDFSFQVNNATAVKFEADGSNELAVNAGTYNVTEVPVANYTPTYANCAGIQATNGATSTCTITNTYVPPVVDVCPNIDEVQTTLPVGMQIVDGQCVPLPPVVDICKNIEGVQEILGKGYVVNNNGECHPLEVSCQIGSNLLQNASFETPSVSGDWNIFALVTGWTISNDGLELWKNFMGTGAGSASHGAQNAELDGNSPSTISQTVTTVPGATYELSFDFAPRASRDLADNAVDVIVNGGSLVSASADGSVATTNVWTTYKKTFVATTTSTLVEFKDVGTANSYGTLVDNTSLCRVKEAPTCSVTAVSDTATNVTETAAPAQLLSFIHPEWTASIPGASWIWGTNPVADAVNETTQTFTRTFVWNGPVASANLDISADNSYTVTLNGNPIGADAGENNHALATQDTYVVPGAAFVQGVNTLTFQVKNFAQAGGVPESNPAGLLYKFTAKNADEQCSPKNGTLTLLKTVVNQYDTPALDTAFTLTATGPTSISGIEGAQSVTNAVVAPGSYTIGENGGPSGYASSLSCMINGDPIKVGASLNVSAGNAYVCTITNTKLAACSDGIDNDADGDIDYVEGNDGGDNGCSGPNDNSELRGGSIIIDKVVTGSGASTTQTFNFDYGWVEGLTNAALSADGAPLVIEGLSTGSSSSMAYSFSEVNLPSGWSIDGVVCTSGNEPETDTNPNLSGVTVNLGQDESVKCVVTNRYTSGGDGENTERIIVKKEVTAGSDTRTLFGFDVSWLDNDGESDFMLAHGGSMDSGDLMDGDYYNVSEVALPLGWSLSKSSSCVSSQEREVDIFDDILLHNGETITCTFVNDQMLYNIYGNVWEDANENNENDEEAALEGWTVNITNGPDTFSTTTDASGNYRFFVPRGTWTITETLPSGWGHTFPDTEGVSYVVTVPGEELPAEVTLLDSFMAFFVPTAEAAVNLTTYGPYSFGNVRVATGCTSNCGGGGSSSTGTKVKRNSSGEVRGDSDENKPVGEVKGAVAPVGAPNTGAGGAAAQLSLLTSFVLAALIARGARKTAQ